MLSRYCSSLICPRTSDMSLAYVVPTSELSQDHSRHFWCNHCSKQCAIMNWATENKYPFVRVQGQMRYAVMGNADDWFTSVASAGQDMVDALYETLVEQKRAPLSLSGDNDENVKRVAKWLETAE
jgi:hypothetical protein